jgi:hypothetical protein
MLTRICLIVAIVAAAFVGGWNIVKVREKITTLVTDRNTQRDGRVAAEGERDKTRKELVKSQKDLVQSKQELADANAEREKAVANLTVQVKRADDLSDKLAKTAGERDDAQTKLQAYVATGVTSDQVGKLNTLLKNTREALEVANEEKLVLQHTRDRLQARLWQYEGTNQDIPMRADLRGRIVVVDPKWDFVVLNIGQDQGVVDRGELLVSREGKLVAKVVVRSIERNRSIANILPGWKLGEVIEGDEVTPAHPST